VVSDVLPFHMICDWGVKPLPATVMGAEFKGFNEVRYLSGRQLLSCPSVINGRIERRLEAD